MATDQAPDRQDVIRRLEEEEPPEAPIWFSAEEAAAWQSGWNAGRAPLLALLREQQETKTENKLGCVTCGAPNFYTCGCYDRCRCGHDRRTHLASGVCTMVGCSCVHGLHGRAKGREDQ